MPAMKKPVRREFRYWPVLILIATVLVYFPTLFNRFVFLDDGTYVVNNPLLRDGTMLGLKAIFAQSYFTMYHPVTILSYWLEYQAFGLAPAPYHITNLLLHLANVFLAFQLFRNLSGDVRVAALVSALFAIHPMHVESVAWVSQRKDVLYAFFYLSAAVLYCRLPEMKHRTVGYFLLLAACLGALLSKPAAVTLPVVLLLIAWYRGRAVSFRAVADLIPLFVMAIVFGLVAMTQHQELGDEYMSDYSLGDRLIILSHSLSFYLTRFFAPVALSAIYFYPYEFAEKIPTAYYLSPFVIAAFAALLYMLRSIRREVIFGALFFLVSISVMMQVVAFGLSPHGDRYTYIPYLGFYFILATWFFRNVPRWNASLSYGLLAAALVVLAVSSHQRLGVWRDGETLLSDVVEKNPAAYRGFWLRGNMRTETGNAQGALDDYTQALELNPYFPLAWHDRGNVLFQAGEYAHALEDFNRAIELDSTFSLTYRNRAIILANNGDLPGALRDVGRCLEISPDDQEARRARGIYLAQSGDFDASLREFGELLKEYADDSTIVFDAAVAHFMAGDTATACGIWERAVGLGSKRARTISSEICRLNHDE
jgi:protein O-mannosyl-transferase